MDDKEFIKIVKPCDYSEAILNTEPNLENFSSKSNSSKYDIVNSKRSKSCDKSHRDESQSKKMNHLMPFSTRQLDRLSSYELSQKKYITYSNDKLSLMNNLSNYNNMFSETNSMLNPKGDKEVQQGLRSKIWKYANKITKDVIDRAIFDNKSYKNDNEHKLSNF